MSSPLPKQIEAYLLRFERRRRAIALARAAAVSAAVALAWGLAACLVDRAMALPAMARAALLGANLVFLLKLIGRPAVQWLRGGIDWERAAAGVESRDAGFGEALRTVVSQSLLPGPRRASGEMLAELSRQVEPRLANSDPRRLLPMRRLGQDVAVVGVLLLLALGLSFHPTLGLGRLAQRYLFPWTDVPPVTTTRIEVRPGDATVIRGQGLRVLATIERGGDAPATLYRGDGPRGPWQPFTMAPAGDGGYAFAFGGVDRDLAYYVAAGDARSPLFTVRAVSRPGAAGFELRYEYPPAMERPAAVASNTSGAIEAPRDTVVTLTMRATEPLSAAHLDLYAKPIPLALSPDGTAATGTFTLADATTYDLRLTSRLGVDGGETSVPVRVLPDRPPAVRMNEPAADLRASPWDILPVSGTATDDYGVWSFAARLTAPGTTRDVAMGLTGHPSHASGAATVDLAEMDLKVGDVVTVVLVAADGRGQGGASDARAVLIAPAPVDAAGRARETALVRAAIIAGELSATVEAARKDLDAARGVDPRDGARAAAAWARVRNRLAAAAEVGARLRVTLDAAVPLSTAPALSAAVIALADDATFVASAAEEAVGIIDTQTLRTDRVHARLSAAADRARRAAEELPLLARGQAATLLAADLATLPSVAGRDGAEIAALRRQIAARAAALSIDPATPDGQAALKRIVDDGAAVVGRRGMPEFTGDANEWAGELPPADDHRPFLDKRLEAAARAEAKRPVAELVRARDLLLAARAAAAIAKLPAGPPLDEAKRDFPPAWGKMAHEHAAARAYPTSDHSQLRAEADAARDRMRKWAGDLTADRELLALEAAARAARGDAQAAREALNKLREQSARAATARPTTGPAESALADAEALDRFAAEQRAASEQASRAKPEEAKSLAVRQADAAKTLDSMSRRTPGLDRRTVAARELERAEQELSALDRQIDAEASAANTARTEADRATQAKKTAEAAPSENKAAAARDAEKAQADASAASAKAGEQRGKTDAASASIAKRLAAAPMTRAATESLGSAAASIAKARSAQANDAAAQQGTAEAKAAVNRAREQVRDARQALAARDPLAVARASATSAADALRTGDTQGAAARQREAAAAASRAAQDAVRRVATAAMADAQYGQAGASPATGDGGPPGPISEANALPPPVPPGSSTWATGTRRTDGPLSPGPGESIAPGYQDSIRIYFDAIRTLNQEPPK